MKILQDRGRVTFRTRDFSAGERKSLEAAGFLSPVVKGWYLAARPGVSPGDSTPWFAAMRDFVAGYCEARFGNDWYVAPAFSLSLHAGATVLPKQVIAHTRTGNNTVLALPGDCSLVDYKAPDFPASNAVEVIGGIRVLPIAAALVRVSEMFFKTAADDAQILLTRLTDASDINRELLSGGHSVVAGRLAGALRAVGRPELADDIMGTMKSAGYTVTETNPFERELPALKSERMTSPYVLRMKLMWSSMRDDVLRHFGADPGLPKNTDVYMKSVQDAYKHDAYHSLSIEGFRVTEELIERVANGDWNPEKDAKDADMRNALAAHGYWRAFKDVEGTLQKILDAANAGEIVRADHGSWYRALFTPSVEAGILTAADLAGYRNAPVYIKNAAHVPPSREAVHDMMPVLFDLLAAEPSAAVRAVLGHFVFVFIHPYMDGNGRIARFLMNAMLGSGGYPWTVIRVEWRDEYMAALDAASARHDINPFAEFVAKAVAGRKPESPR